jgi:predicted RNA binding protein YcfA (HicA-like mRNA interferase family)
MSKASAALERVLSGHGQIRFRDLQRLILKLGFRLDRIRGSHHIYVHPKATRPLNVQPIGNEAKQFQVRQLKVMIEEFDLRLEDE